MSERTKTFYDKHDATGIVDPIEQKNLKNRVAAVVVIEAEKTDESQADVLGAITRYSYDIHGNVEKLWQKMPQETGAPEKTVEYNYDLLSGKVNEVIYNRGGELGNNDEFRHRYLYDGDNRLTQVETSLDGYHWTLEASYFYYAHGPLARIETGQHNIQGTDYFYTLQGWIKGVNSIGLTHTRQDPGRDGYTGYTEEEAQNPTFNRDEYAYALNYYEGDYEARGENHLLGKAFHANEIYSNFKNYEDKVGGVTYNRESLYNGNIAAMATSIRHFGELQSTQSMNYRYDQLHRIAAAHASKWEGIWTTVEGSYNTSYAYDGNGNIQNLYRNNLEATTIDELYYHYDPVKKNRLDVVKDGGTAEGLNNANPYEYKYDQIGNLTQNLEDGIEDIEWNIYGKVEKVSKTNGTLISYRYDGIGNRILKEVRTTTTVHTNFYLRDASGNVMAIYEKKTDQNIAIKEIPIYGSSRLGQYRPKAATKKTALGQRIYEFSNHLGNVLVTLTDNKVPQTDGTYSSVVVSASDYYPFGMAMSERTYSNSEYRYGFNGKENDTDFGSHIQDLGARFYSGALGRMFSVDPLTKDYPELTPYQFASNRPIWAIDFDGLSTVYKNGGGSNPRPRPRVRNQSEVIRDLLQMMRGMNLQPRSATGVPLADFSIVTTYKRARKPPRQNGPPHLRNVPHTPIPTTWGVRPNVSTTPIETIENVPLHETPFYGLLMNYDPTMPTIGPQGNTQDGHILVQMVSLLGQSLDAVQRVQGYKYIDGGKLFANPLGEAQYFISPEINNQLLQDQLIYEAKFKEIQLRGTSKGAPFKVSNLTLEEFNNLSGAEKMLRNIKAFEELGSPPVQIFNKNTKALLDAGIDAGVVEPLDPERKEHPSINQG